MNLCLEKTTKGCTTSEMYKYSLGGCTESLILNSFFGFSMLYYTKALGLSPQLAGIATGIAALWDAISDPIMGHVSDNTKSRFGKRFPYMFMGGVLMIITFFFIWYVPETFKKTFAIGSLTISKTKMLFGYLVIMNLLLRTAYTVFVVPYTALGFEICTDYSGRSKIQGIRTGLNMAANLLGPAMAWAIFFKNNSPQVKDTQIARNYISMGTVFTIASFVFLFTMLGFTSKYIKDSRGSGQQDKHISFFQNITDILKDRYSRYVFVFIFFVMLGIVLVSTLQMFVFDDFMKLSGIQKTIAHGGTMVGMGLGSLSLTLLRSIDKKRTIYIVVLWSVFCEIVLAVIFLTGLIEPTQSFMGIPAAFVLFVFLHSGYWFGNGILMPIAISMIADVSEVNKLIKGANKDASYAAMFSLAVKISMAVSGLLAGFCLSWTGFQSGSDAVQTAESIWRVCAITFIVGPLASLAALALIMKYPVDEEFIKDIRIQYENKDNLSSVIDAGI